MFLAWFDDNPKKTTGIKIAEAIAAYMARFQVRPTVVLVNAADLVEVPGVTIRAVGYVRANTFWVGQEGDA
ncbi:MAG: hypothetical protein IPK75_17710 [Acidobacteria bacterium]|nr:hypothetical protein [Acidobacteriota bacterium]